MNVNIDEAMVPSTARAASGSMPDSQPITASIACRIRAIPSAATMLAKGRIQMEFRT